MSQAKAAEAFSEDEVPTREILVSATLVVASKIERLCEVAIEKLRRDLSESNCVSVSNDIVEIKTLANRIMR